MWSQAKVSHNQTEMQETLIKPAIKGTVNVLNSCTKARSVKRVALTSTCSAIRYHDNIAEISPLMSRIGAILSNARDTIYVPNEHFLSLLCSSTYTDTHNIVWQLWYAYAKTLAEKKA